MFHEDKDARADSVKEAMNGEDGWYERGRNEVSLAVKGKYTKIINKGTEWKSVTLTIIMVFNTNSYGV
jgi:hypothetical protein